MAPADRAPGCSPGFSLIEAIVATALTLAITAVVFALVEPARAGFAVQPEAADMRQRLRVAAATLYKDLAMAGAGMSQGANQGPLVHYFAPVLPYRAGTGRDDPPGTFRSDLITVMYVPPTVAQATLAGPGPEGAVAEVLVNDSPGCPLGIVQCGFKSGMDLIVYNRNGLYDTFTATAVRSDGMDVERIGATLTYDRFEANTTSVAELATIVYSLNTDGAAGVDQLASREGAGGSNLPVVDHLVGLTFEYYGDPQPPALTGVPLDDPAGPWTTYGPRPPALPGQIPTGGYPAGENCTFVVDPGSGLHVPRLPVLEAGSGPGGLVLLTAAQLTDGPWCPDAANANRWDADLLRIRTIGITLRVEAADPAMRGPAGLLFAHGGTSRSGTRRLPDQAVRFQVTPPNLQGR